MEKAPHSLINGMDKNNNRSIPPEQRRDTAKDKKRIKKIFIAIVAAFAALGIIMGVLLLVLELIKPEESDISYEDYRFFEADYSKNIFEDKVYMRKNRAIMYDRYGLETEIKEENAVNDTPAASLFYEYFHCLMNGEYTKYRDFFTNAYLESDECDIPEKFTMQAVYNINVKLHSIGTKEIDGTELSYEIYEVSYQIFENNGTFRRDILPDESRTIVFELYIYNGAAKINSIGYRANG